ncbi:SPARC-related modular calcium-binding protein 2-like isoform X2 [Arctopsyche grandis]|uniref:SPARC-related modular calcium-binding protein 2-like isoform X2 n=1 Tax=Arctopsyche grandis TaxID=121162 RepID=UPI00406D8F2D
MEKSIIVANLLLVFVVAIAWGNPLTKTDCQAKFTECKDLTKRSVCGNDGRTYDQCKMAKMQCEGSNLSVQYRGACWDSQPCLEGLRYMKKMENSGGNSFVPKCRPDGSYAPVQCRRDTECWCVTAQGKSVPNTSVRNGRPKCRREKSNTRRRSSIRGHSNREDCGRADKAQFNLNLVNMLSKEFDRENPVIPSINGKDTVVVEWKFNLLDKDDNKYLDRNEYKAIRRTIKKVVKPYRCARTLDLCDADQNGMITKPEWVSCIMNNTHNLLQGSVPKLSGHPPGFNDDSLDRNKDDGDLSDCLSDRKSMLDEQATVMQKNDTVSYVPECTADGRYRRIQCYPQTGYCWCVNEDSGVPISGTAIKDEPPKCDAFSTPSRPMKGCPEQKKAVFLQDLMKLLKNQMVMNTNRTGLMQTSQEEEIAIWNFVMFDINKNSNLERKEWKTFRQLVSQNRHLRRCGKKFPRYCDVNNDNKITMTEWLNCLNAQRKDTEIVTTKIKSVTFSKRKGPNPLEAYLKGD